jgi:hypothetical protein
MMVRECTSTCYVLFWIVVVPASDPKDLFGDLLAVHQRKCTLGKVETFSHLASDEITNLWVKLCNLYRV